MCCGDSRAKSVTTMIYLFIFLSLYQSHTIGFFLTTSRPGKVTVAPGEKVTLFCAVDDDYEWCKFYNPSGQFCDFEWKRRKGNITTQECQLADKVGILVWASTFSAELLLGKISWGV